MLDVLVWILVIAVLALIGVVFYIYKSTPRVKLTPHETYLEALKALLNNDKGKALLRLKETVMADTNNIDAYLRLTSLLREKGNARRALQVDADLNLRQNLSQYERAEVMLSLAEDYMLLSQYDAAEKVLQELKKFPERRAAAASKLVKLFTRKKDWRKAVEYQEEYLKHQDIDDKSSLAELKLKHGHELKSNEKFHEARVEYRSALKYNPNLAEAVIAIGDSYEKEGKLENAVKAWKKIIDVDASKAGEVFNRIQKVLFDLGQYGEIEEFYNQVLEKDPKNLQSLLGLASISEKRGDGVVAEDYYNQVLEMNPEYMPALLGLIRFYQRQQRTDDAARVINKTAQTLLKD
ncbi:MAG TPA: tetratricopeptide repeat protein [candidate division Zixibacteria bacterium]|mgnify:CR=1 FL=1|nr:tetratricopeptide repeat protein [candidate division Zixibacteria bacterium]HEQ99722.1 tetratricopeptide repeat protein [candidate division Zixibacteria bacterium]